ncbi:hypothetical protein EDD11_003568 [Mortierella claussenii]|nr:hypothetical protein EDD11_003568 [Mortierella claussenii]
MPILRSMTLNYTLRRPILDCSLFVPPPLTFAEQTQESERGHAVQLQEQDRGDYPQELLQLRIRTLQDHISVHYPQTFIYIGSLLSILVIFLVLVVTLLALHVQDGKPWVLGFIVILILLFVAKMSFLSSVEKAHKGITTMLQTYNDQDMPHYGTLYRIRPSSHQQHCSSSLSWISRCAYRLNLGLPRWTIDLTTINHIDEYSFQNHPAEGPHASPQEILARQDELPTYRPKVEAEDDSVSLHQLPQHSQRPQLREVVLGEAQPPNYDEVVLDLDTPIQSATTH